MRSKTAPRPGIFEFDLSHKPAVLMLAAEGHLLNHIESIETRYLHVRTMERHRRSSFASPRERAADAYLVRRGEGKTIIAGYPWFGDWGRDTFIAIRGLCIATGRLEDARDILVQWAGVVSEGMLPNRFPDQGEAPEFNSVDASLWYIIAVGDYLRAVERQPEADPRLSYRKVARGGRGNPHRLSRRHTFPYSRRYRRPARGRRTWLPAHLDGRARRRTRNHAAHRQTGRNPGALAECARHRRAVFAALADRSSKKVVRRSRRASGMRTAIISTTWSIAIISPERSIVTFRPNQIFAVGGLPLMLLSPERARQVVDAVEARLLTPLGLRSLAPDEPGYVGHYGGGVAQRDGSYHQGTVWPWLIGAFVEAWVRVRGNSAEAKAEARARFLPPLSSNIWIMPASATSRKLPMAIHRTARRLSASRPGR